MATDPHNHFTSGSDHTGTAELDAKDLREKAARCRRLAAGISDQQAATVLRSMATSYELDAGAIDGD